jgi:MFS family permease
MSAPYGSRGTHILVVLAIANLVAYAARNALFAVYETMTVRYGIDDAELGFLQTVFMLPHAAATLPFGWAGDRFDRRYVIVAGLGLASVAGALGAIGSSYTGLAVSRAVVGLGTAAVVPVANSILGQIFDGPYKASRMSIFNLGLFLGGIVGFGGGIVFDFPLVVVALAIPGLVLSIMIARLPVPPPPAPLAGSRAPQGALAYLHYMGRLFITDAQTLLRIRTLRWVIASTTAMAFAAGGYNAWLQEFLVRDKGMTKDQAGGLLGMALVGGLSGILVGGRVADRLTARSPAGRLWTIVIGMAMTVPCAAIAIEVPAGPGLYAAGITTLFFISWYHAPMAASVDDLAPTHLAVTAQGLVIFTMHMVGTAPSSWIVGAISDSIGLHLAMWVPTAGLVVAAACMAVATRTFAADVERARGTDPPPSL